MQQKKTESKNERMEGCRRLHQMSPVLRRRLLESEAMLSDLHLNRESKEDAVLAIRGTLTEKAKTTPC
jgi:hypothetical protein